jgi:DNA modification methylase
MQQKSLLGFESFAGSSPKAKLEEKFIVPPFSILDTRQGYWQDRKRAWLSLGIKSEVGRGETLTYSGKQITTDNLNYYRNLDKPEHKKVNGLTFKSTGFMADILTERGGGTSIFDPVLCELVYKWFCPEQGVIFDPFAGGSVRGIVANILGYNYYGIDLNKIQIAANIEEGKLLTLDNPPHWFTGDSEEANTLIPQLKADLIFTCPPYHDLEQYTDEMEDLSNMSWESFKDKYKRIISNSVLMLKDNRFACFVVSEIRDDKGFLKGLVPFTIEAFRQGGMRLYNEIILVNAIGSLPVRINGQFQYRKIGRTHQNVLVFYKGLVENIPKHFNNIDTGLEIA